MLPGQWGEAYSGYQEQMGLRMNEDVVLLQTTSAHLPTGGKSVHILRSNLCSLDFWTEPL
jgi:hypothetical protein